MTWNRLLTNLTYVLAGLYPLTQDSYRLVDNAGIPRQYVPFQPRAVDNWHEILAEAAKREKVSNLVHIAHKDYPDNPYLAQALAGKLDYLNGPVIGEDIDWKEPGSDDIYEKITGMYSTLLPISFLEDGIQRAVSVARVRRHDGALGTGFLIQNNLLLTNHHVIRGMTEAESAVVEFNYQQTTSGLNLEPREFALDPHNADYRFATSSENDWTCVKIRGDPNQDFGYIELAAIDPSELKRVNIIQHPGGGPKQVALYHNVVTYADNRRIQYLTDTLPGSSGSPVFDSQWRLVAIHHSGGHIREPSTKQIVFRNEGITINCILDGLRDVGMTP